MYITHLDKRQEITTNKQELNIQSKVRKKSPVSNSGESRATGTEPTSNGPDPRGLAAALSHQRGFGCFKLRYSPELRLPLIHIQPCTLTRTYAHSCTFTHSHALSHTSTHKPPQRETGKKRIGGKTHPNEEKPTWTTQRVGAMTEGTRGKTIM